MNICVISHKYQKEHTNCEMVKIQYKATEINLLAENRSKQNENQFCSTRFTFRSLTKLSHMVHTILLVYANARYHNNNKKISIRL